MPIVAENLSYTYQVGTPYAVPALADVSFRVEDGQCWGIIGATGSGKSTLMQHLNGLLRPTSGRIVVDGVDTRQRRLNLRPLRQKVGLVFQYPEQQLFAETVLADIAFGPRNFGLSQEQAEARARRTAIMVGLPEAVLARSPFAISGGQARRAALAGVLAMGPRVLVLDEPTAGLDPRGRAELLELIRRLHREEKLTVMVVSHSMDDIAGLAQQVLVLHQGRVLMQGTPRAVFARRAELEAVGLAVPAASQLVQALKGRGWPVPATAVTPADAVSEVLAALDRKGGRSRG